MSLLRWLSNNKKSVDLAPQPILLRNVAAGSAENDAVNLSQVVTKALAETISGAKTFTGGIAVDTITPATSGAGTSSLVPALVRTTTGFTPTLSGGNYMLSKVDGLTVALPVLTAAMVGTRFKFYIGLSCTSVGYVITTGAGSTFLGGLYCTVAAGSGAAADSEFNIATGANNTLTLGATTACGLAGGWVEVVAVSTTVWAVSGVCLGSGTIASNLFTTV